MQVANLNNQLTRTLGFNMAIIRKTNNLKQLAKSLARHELQVGVISSAQYENGESVAMVARVQEYGTNKIPPRPFMRPAIHKNLNAWREIYAQNVTKALQSGNTRQPLELVGLQAVGDIKRGIKAVTNPPLKPATIANRLRGKNTKGANMTTATKPLIDTGLLLNSINYEVK